MVYGCPSKKPSRAAKVAYGCPSKNPSRASKAAGDQPKVMHIVGSKLHALKQISKKNKDKVEPTVQQENQEAIKLLESCDR